MISHSTSPQESPAIEKKRDTGNVIGADFAPRYGPDELPVPGRESTLVFAMGFLYLLIPTLILLFRFQSWRIALPVAVAGIAGAVWGVARAWPGTEAQRFAVLNTWPYLLLAAGFVWLSGVMPPFAENSDWVKHYALLNELINQPWPPAVPDGDTLGTLRYSLSYYVFPALAAKLFGTDYLGVALLVWTTLGLYLAMVLAFGSRTLEVSTRFLLGTVFMLFSGADIIGTYIEGAVQRQPMHFEWWAKIGQLSSSTTGLFWTPQHSVSAWIATFLVLRYPKHALEGGGVVLAAVAVWSPFGAIGLVPVFAWAAYRSGVRHLFSWVNILVAPVLLAAAAFFLTRGSAGIPAGFIWNLPGFTKELWLTFLLLEFGAIALALVIAEPRSLVLVGISTLFLAVLALFNLGAYNDLLMRASLPALAILAALSASVVAYKPNTLRKAPLIVCLVVGLVTPVGEIMRGIVGTRVPNNAELWIPDIVGGDNRYLAPQYLVPGFSGVVERRPVLTLPELRFFEFGKAQFDLDRKHIESSQFADAALVSNELNLPRGLYELDVVLGWDVAPAAAGKHAAHVSLHGEQLLIPIQGSASAAEGGHFRAYFRSRGKPLHLSFGLGGWSEGKGSIELRQLTVSAIRTEH